jgi:hypothetical protein
MERNETCQMDDDHEACGWLYPVFDDLKAGAAT